MDMINRGYRRSEEEGSDRISRRREKVEKKGCAGKHFPVLNWTYKKCLFRVWSQGQFRRALTQASKENNRYRQGRFMKLYLRRADWTGKRGTDRPSPAGNLQLSECHLGRFPVDDIWMMIFFFCS
jgi:hypothetical protein